MNIRPGKAGIRAKLIAIFVVIKVLPLAALALLAWEGVEELGAHLSRNLAQRGAEMRATAGKVGHLALDAATVALDRQAQEAIERQTVVTANAVADFLHSVDRDVTYVASFEPSAAVYRRFLASRNREIPVPAAWHVNDAGTAWVADTNPSTEIPQVSARLADNAKEFHYRAPDAQHLRESRPVYLELTFVDLKGNEKIKVTTSPRIDPRLRNVSQRENTWIRAETYFRELAQLRDDEIYVSDVIGAYVPSPIIGAYTPARARQAQIPFRPEEAAYAGKENPVGKHFQGLVRWAKPVIRNGRRIGYVTLALDHDHLMGFTDHLVPTAERFSDISDASTGNYAFMWDYRGRNISHPRDYFIVGYDPDSGLPVAPWLDKSTYDAWQKSGLPITTFLQSQPQFQGQSLKLKPALEQIKRGEVALDCRYLNFAPQCSGWWNLTRHGGSGSFLIFWSGIWKLTTAATIPYFTGRYGDTPRGFGFVTIGANVHEFHLPATTAQAQIDDILKSENEQLVAQQNELNAYIYGSLERMAFNLSTSTLIMVILVVVIAVWMASYLTKRIRQLIEGLKQFRSGDLRYRFAVTSGDEMGELATSFNTVADTIEVSVRDLQHEIARRREAETGLEEAKRDLEITVENRTRELQEANEKLLIENQERRKAEVQLKFMAQYDDLTGLANRALFRDHLSMALAQAQRKVEKVGLLFIDLDKFKEVNDSYGHSTGDALLITVGSLLEHCVRGGDTASRLGGDEFALIINSVADSDQLADLAQRAIDLLSADFTINNHPLSVGCSIGITMYPDDGTTTEDLLKNADIAMYQAKRKGGGSFQFFISEMQIAVEQHMTLERELRSAIVNQEFELHYQPKVDIRSGTVVGAEALVRWNHPRLGLVFPGDFIPLAERTGLINALGEIVLREACNQARIWQHAGCQSLRVAVNVSAVQLRNSHFVDSVRHILAETGLPPNWLEIELTESAVMHDHRETCEIVGQLKALGVAVSIDDFGTGYSSFERLKQLSFDTIKIDRGFIRGIGNPTDNAVVRAIIGMAHTLHIQLLAEGVENAGQLQFLALEGCDQYQGFHFSPALSAERFEAVLESVAKQAG